MNHTDRTALLARFDTANVWLTRIYDDQHRSPEHRLGLAKLFNQCVDPRTRRIAERTWLIDVDTLVYVNQFKN